MRAGMWDVLTTESSMNCLQFNQGQFWVEDLEEVNGKTSKEDGNGSWEIPEMQSPSCRTSKPESDFSPLLQVCQISFHNSLSSTRHVLQFSELLYITSKMFSATLAKDITSRATCKKFMANVSCRTNLSVFGLIRHCTAPRNLCRRRDQAYAAWPTAALRQVGRNRKLNELLDNGYVGVQSSEFKTSNLGFNSSFFPGRQVSSESN